jgi:hypothetical protein
VRRIRIVAGIAGLILLSTARVEAQECPPLSRAASDELVSYLDGAVPNQENAECITFAIKMLEKRRYEPAIPVLTKLLDFRRPRTAEEKAGVITLHTFYPATSALEEIGKASLPSVLAAIKADTTSEKARENAVSVWMELHKYDESPEGVALLKREADETDDAAIKQRLTWAVSKALTWCNPPDKEKCKTAAETGRTN